MWLCRTVCFSGVFRFHIRVAWLPKIPFEGLISSHLADVLQRPLFSHKESDIPAVEFFAAGSGNVKLRNHF